MTTKVLAGLVGSCCSWLSVLADPVQQVVDLEYQAVVSQCEAQRVVSQLVNGLGWLV